MEISIATIVASFVFPIFLGGIIFTLFRNSIKTMNDNLVVMIKDVKADLTKDIEDSHADTYKCEKALHRRLDKLDEGLNTKMSKGGCQRVQDRIAMETKYTRELVAAQGKQNSKEHEALIKTLEIVDKKQDASNEGMAEIITCLALLSENIPCIPGKNDKPKGEKK